MDSIILTTLSIIFLWLLKNDKNRILLILTVYLLLQLILWKSIDINDLILFSNIIYQPIFLITSQIIVCYVFKRLGFFKWAAHTIIFTAEGSEVKLLLHILFFSLLLTVLSNVYAAAIIITLMIYDISQNIRLAGYKTIRFVLLSNLVIDVSSIISPSSSLNNLIYMKLLSVDYNNFIRGLMLPGIIAILVLLISTYAIGRRRLSNFTNNNIVDPDIFIKDWKLLNLCFLNVFIVQISYILINNKIPIYLMPLILSIIILLYMFKNEKCMEEHIDFKVYIFPAMAILIHFLAVYCLLANTYYFNPKLEVIQSSPIALIIFKIRMFFTSAALAGVFGNISGAMINIKHIKALKDFTQSEQSVIYMSIIGNIMGGKIFFLGSLSSIFSARMMRRKGFSFSLREYFAIVIPLAVLCGLALMFAALLAV